MDNKEMALYAAQMEEIKRRLNVIEYYLTGKRHALYEPTTIESSCLQVRKVLELIAFSTLVSNKSMIEEVQKKFSNWWNSEFLLKDIERVNPDFYPQPVRYKSIENSREKHEIVNFEGNFLDKHEFVKVYKKCGGIMHARNPIGRKISYEYYRVNLPIWLEKINNLLKIHEIKLIRHDGLNIIFMENDEGNVIFRPHTRVSS